MNRTVRFPSVARRKTGRTIAPLILMLPLQPLAKPLRGAPHTTARAYGGGFTLVCLAVRVGQSLAAATATAKSLCLQNQLLYGSPERHCANLQACRRRWTDDATEGLLPRPCNVADPCWPTNSLAAVFASIRELYQDPASGASRMLVL